MNSQGLISWTPSSLLSGPQLVRVQVSDQRGGIAIQEFTVRLATQFENADPRIISNPVLHALEGSLYEYQASILDRDGDAVLWTFVQAPRGMSIDTTTGTIRWRPSSDQLGAALCICEQPILLEHSMTGLFIRVSCVNTPPLIVSSPSTQASVGRDYFYGVLAKDLEDQTVQFPWIPLR